MPQLTPAIQKSLYDETDARFAAQTGITRKLDPNNAIDAHFREAWGHLYAQVLAAYNAGTLTFTSAHPVIAGLINEARKIGDYAADAFHRAASVLAPASPSASPVAPAPAQIDAAQAHVEEAKQHHARAAEATAAAANAQAAMDRSAYPSAPPIRVSPELVRRAHEGVMTFVMSPGGQGVQVGGPTGATVGSDTVTAMQAADAPAQVAQAEDDSAVAAAAEGSRIERAQRTALLVGGGLAVMVLAGLGLAKLDSKRSRSSAGPRMPRMPRAPQMGAFA